MWTSVSVKRRFGVVEENWMACFSACMRWDEKPCEPGTPFDANPIGAGRIVSSTGNAEGRMEPVPSGSSFAQALGVVVVKK